MYFILRDRPKGDGTDELPIFLDFILKCIDASRLISKTSLKINTFDQTYLIIPNSILRMKLSILAIIVLLKITLLAQSISLDAKNLEASNVFLSYEKINNEKVLKVAIDTAIKTFDQATFAKIKDIELQNGIIEVKVLSRLMKDAPSFARGFIGLAFRVSASKDKFEGIYVRPTNGRADDQIRRNHSIQYFSFPGYDFDRLRKESPEKFESYADLGLNEWITMRIEVKGQKARLYLNHVKQPSLIVNDLKLGEHHRGGIGLWVGNYTEGFFKDLKVVKN